MHLLNDTMKTPAIWTEADVTIKEAASIMMENNVGSLIIKENNKVIGIVTRTDLIKTIQI